MSIIKPFVGLDLVIDNEALKDTVIKYMTVSLD